MTQPWSLEFGGISLGTKGAAAPREANADEPFRMLVLGDFGGRGEGSKGKPIQLDRDNFEQVMSKLGVEVRLTLPDQAEPLSLRITELDDFSPDRLYQRVPVFEELRLLRGRLQNPRTFAEAAAEVRSWGKQSPAEAPAEGALGKPLTDLSSDELLEMMLGGSASPAPTAPKSDPLQDYIRKLVEPHVIAGADESALVEVVDEVAAARMRALLHHPSFQALEAAWRSLALLVRRLDTDGNLKLYLLDVSREELTADLQAADLSASRAYQFLVEQPLGTPGGVPWALFVGNYTFAPTLADAALAARLAHLSQAAGAAFVAGAKPSFVGVKSLASASDPQDWTTPPDAKGAEVWQALRQLPQADHFGLALPRFLLRQPYGKEGSLSEEFVFEEITPDSDHEDYLWGNSAFIGALLIGQAFERRGWGFRPGMVEDCDGLPTWVREVDGESELLPCAEVLLRDKAARGLWERGLIAVQSIQGRDAIRIAQFPSIADPAKPLAGRWQR